MYSSIGLGGVSVNIFSGEPGLGGALTNPTELARQKGSIKERYAVTFRKRTYSDVETAYHQLKTDSATTNDALMVELIACKLRQHPRLLNAITARGGVSWLETCSHYTKAKSEQFSSWEGMGRNSRFIRNLIAGYELALTDLPVGEAEQMDLFG